MSLVPTQSSKVCKCILMPSPSIESIGTAMYQFYQIFICLLKLDFFCFVGVTMQVSVC